MDKFFVLTIAFLVSFGIPLEMYGTQVLENRRRKNRK